jgi:crotonobetainyl-CoA:carnitine CoA-transferase CaiB-like acyl-CoA transferase
MSLPGAGSVLRSSPPAGEAWAALGGQPADLDRVTVAGDPAGLLPSRLKVQELMTAAAGSAILAVATLDAARNHTAPAPVSLSADHIAVAARSERYARRTGSDTAVRMAPLSRFWKASDGWVRLHANYPWHLRRALHVLGCEDDPGLVGPAIAARTTADLEEAFAAAGGLAFAVRTLDEWTSHPQGQAVASQALVGTDAGPGPGRKLPAGRALDGIRVLDLTRVIAGPVATRTLAAWGADVLRLDAPQLPEIATQAIDTLLGKRSALLDLSSRDGYQQLQRLLAEADLLVQGYRPGALARFGLAPEALAERWPHLSVVTLSAWGSSGPWSGRRGFDSLVQCPSGIAAIEGSADEPGAMPAQALDHATGYLAAAAGIMALAARHADGHPRYQRLSLARTARWFTDAGRAAQAAPRDQAPGPLLTEVPGAGFTVRVVRPPGQVGELRPAWNRAAGLGADPPEFASRPRAGTGERDARS